MKIYSHVLLLCLIRIQVTLTNESDCRIQDINDVVQCMDNEKIHVDYLLKRFLQKGDIPGGAKYWKEYFQNYKRCVNLKGNIGDRMCCSSPKDDKSNSTCSEFTRLSQIWTDNGNKIINSFKCPEESIYFWKNL